MAFDLRAALLKKGETESARLDAFEYRLRARTMLLLGDRLDCGLTREEMAHAVATQADENILNALLGRFPNLEDKALRQMYLAVRAEARAELIAALGDPTPHRLA